MGRGCAFILLIGFMAMMYLCSESSKLINSTEVPDIEYTQEQRDSINKVEYLKKLENGAYSVARYYVRQSLKYPNSAKFPMVDRPLIENLGDSTFQVSHYVRAKNSFGMEGKMYYSAKLQFAGDDPRNENNWVLWDLKTSE